jgi:hypothetical protein
MVFFYACGGGTCPAHATIFTRTASQDLEWDSGAKSSRARLEVSPAFRAFPVRREVAIWHAFEMRPYS